MTTLSDGTMVEVEPILVVRSVVAALVVVVAFVGGKVVDSVVSTVEVLGVSVVDADTSSVVDVVGVASVVDVEAALVADVVLGVASVVDVDAASVVVVAEVVSA